MIDKKWVLLGIFFFGSLASLEFGPSISPTAHLDERFEFSLKTSDYFREELELPSAPHITDGGLKKRRQEELKVSTEYLEDGGWRLVFTFPEKIEVKETKETNSLNLEFNQTVDSKDLSIAEDKLGFLIKRIANGYKTLYLVAKRPVIFQTSIDKNVFTLDISPDYDGPVEDTEKLQIAKARLLGEERKYVRAIRSTTALWYAHPDSREIPILLASIEGLVPRWKRQVQILNALHHEYPEDQDVTNLLYDAYSPHSSYVQVERQVQRTVGLAAVQLYQIQAEQILRSTCRQTLYAGTQQAVYRGHISGIINKQGNTVGFRGTREQGNLYLRNEWENGSRLMGSVYAQESCLGVGLEGGYIFRNLNDGMNITAVWHRPYWAVFECLAFNGREDLLKLQRYSVVNRYLAWDFGGGVHRVGITGTPNGFSSFILSGNVFINVLIPNPILSFNYSLDAEYVVQRKVKTGVTGNKYNPVPYTSFENHTVRAYLTYLWRDHWYLTAWGGETYNRIGLQAPTAGINIRYVRPLPEGWEIEVSAYRFPSTIVQGATGEYVTGAFTYRY